MSKKLWATLLLFFLLIMWFASPIPVVTGEVGLYTSAELTEPCTAFSYGTVDSNSTHLRVAYLHNNTTVPVVLFMNHTAPSRFTFTWNYTDTQVPSHTAIPLQFTLTVDDTEGPFSFNITIRALEVR